MRRVQAEGKQVTTRQDIDDLFTSLGGDFLGRKTAEKFLKESRYAAKLNFRRIVPPEGYVNPLSNAVSAAANFALYSPTANEVVKNGATVYSELVAHRWPAYFVNRELVDAMIRTEPPCNIRMEEIKWPLPALSFYLPESETLERYVPGFRIGYINLARFEVGDRRVPAQWREHGAHVMHFGCRGVVGVSDYSLCGRLHETLAKVEDSERFHDYSGDDLPDIAEELRKRVAQNNDAAKDSQLISKVNHLAVNLLALMVSRPHLVEEGAVLRKASPPESRKRRSELWSPNWVGRNYVRERSPSMGGHHASPRGHWRIGFWRHQRYGTGRTKIRLIWIDPVFVGK